jgi:hypothetical protein
MKSISSEYFPWKIQTKISLSPSISLEHIKLITPSISLEHIKAISLSPQKPLYYSHVSKAKICNNDSTLNFQLSNCNNCHQTSNKFNFMKY